MKSRIHVLIFHLLIGVLLVACQSSTTFSGETADSAGNGFSFTASAGVKLDANTGTKTHYSGFEVESIYIVNDEDKPLKNNEIPLNSKFSIVYEGLKNYTLKNGKAVPGLSLQVTDAAGKDILNEADLFASSPEGFSETDASVLRGSVTVAEPMKAGQTYHCKIRAFDKNGEAEIISELDFKVK